MYANEHIAELGYRIEATTDVALVRPLLLACGVDPLEDDREPSEYLMAMTTAGGIAACAGWTRVEDAVVLHSLAVAPPSRGSGVGVSLMAMTLALVMDSSPVEAIYLLATGARRFFASYGFTSVERQEIPDMVLAHESFVSSGRQGTPMARHYLMGIRGLDQCAFRLIENDAPGAVLPSGAVVFFKQTGQIIEASYRGGPVRRGHLLGRAEGDHISYQWQAYTSSDELLSGMGEMAIARLPDGRRELREIGAQGGLVMREC